MCLNKSEPLIIPTYGEELISLIYRARDKLDEDFNYVDFFLIKVYHYNKSGNSQRFSNPGKGTIDAGKSHSRRLSRRLNKCARHPCRECFPAFMKRWEWFPAFFPAFGKTPGLIFRRTKIRRRRPQCRRLQTQGIFPAFLQTPGMVLINAGKF